MKAKKYLLLLILPMLFVCCSVQPNLSPMQKRQLTTKMFNCSYENAYRATLTILQDQGYIIKNTDMDSGLIMAGVDRKTATGSQVAQALLFGYISNKGTEVEVSCVVNRLSPQSSEIRISIQEVKYGQDSMFSGTSKQSTKQIYEPELYRGLFNDIQVEIKRREAIEGTGAKTAFETKSDKPVPITNVVAKEQKKIRIKVSEANIMFDPAENSQVIDTAKIGAVFDVVGQKDEWYQVKYRSQDGQFEKSGFIHLKNIQEIDSTFEDPANKRIVTLKNGTSITGIIIKEDPTTITIKSGLGEITIEKVSILKIEEIK